MQLTIRTGAYAALVVVAFALLASGCVSTRGLLAKPLDHGAAVEVGELRHAVLIWCDASDPRWESVRQLRATFQSPIRDNEPQTVMDGEDFRGFTMSGAEGRFTQEIWTVGMRYETVFRVARDRTGALMVLEASAILGPGPICVDPLDP